ncbi:hypothetical protein [Halogranum rubrum]|uniref:hypothetical protein n=1 Tax=Halogranum rubrum TaxID=553466 RepID=UPI0015A53E23|nr:hypothetical protein [Halogranum rubrum]
MDGTRTDRKPFGRRRADAIVRCLDARRRLPRQSIVRDYQVHQNPCGSTVDGGG